MNRGAIEGALGGQIHYWTPLKEQLYEANRIISESTIWRGVTAAKMTRTLKGDSRVNTSLSEKLHFHILIFPQKIFFLKNLCFSPQELSGTNI